MDPEQSYGRQWGGWLGSKAGELIGGLAHSTFTGITGLGAYKVKQNVFLSGRLPEVVNNPQGGGVVVRFQEYLSDIITDGSANTFNIQTFIINAANPRTFPFLSQIAANFEQYELQGMIFEFKSTSADALSSINTALGTVMMATQYDVLDVPFASKLNMLNYEFSSSVKPSESCLHMVECAPRQTTITELYTLYNSNVPEGADPRLYHLGNFHIATTGFQGTDVNIGQLHVTYQVRLLKPKLFTTLGRTCGYYFRVLDAITDNYTDAFPLGTVNALGVGGLSQTNMEIIQTPTTLTLPLSTAILAYRIEVEWIGGTVMVVPPTITATDAAVSDVEFPASVGSTRLTVHIRVNTLGSPVPPVLTFAADGTLPAADATSVVVRIMQVTPIFTAI